MPCSSSRQSTVGTSTGPRAADISPGRTSSPKSCPGTGRRRRASKDYSRPGPLEAYFHGITPSMNEANEKKRSMQIKVTLLGGLLNLIGVQIR